MSKSRFEKSSHVIWHCQYHIVFVPKYRYRILRGKIGRHVYLSIESHIERSGCQVVELNVQPDHVHVLLKIPPRISISELMGKVKGKSAISVFKAFPHLKQKPYWGNHFWASGYCVDTVGLNAEMIQKYVKYQEHKSA